MPSAIEPISATNSSSGASNLSQPSGRPSLRATASTKGDSRRQSGSPSDGGQRRANSQKAWTQGTNPITQRASYSQSNGNMSRQSGSPRPTQKESTAENPGHDRLTRLVSSFTGLQTTITTKAGDRFTGIFSFSALESSDTSFLLKMVRNSPEAHAKSNGVSDSISPYLGTAPDHSMPFETKDIVDISVASVTPAEVVLKESNGSAGFRTDSDISGNLAMRERTLQRWQPTETDHDLSLESASGDNAGWDQFEANERLFGTRTNYDENIYTTRLDRSDPAFRQKQVEATRIAREIEGNQVDNPHMREERGLASDAGDQDEEDKYSGVRRENKAFPPLLSGQPNKYTPPGRRQVTPQPAVPTKTPPAPAASASVPPVPAAKDIAPEEKPPVTKANVEKTTLGKIALPTVPKRTPENATANVEAEVLDQFRQFSATEKLRVAERRRNQVSHDRSVKLNELMRFSKNFKLSTPVPKDLVPILAKDPHKQEAIIQRGQQPTDDTSSPITAAQAPDQKPLVRASGPNGLTPPTAPSDRQNLARARPGYTPTGPLAGPGGRLPQQHMQQGRPGTGMLGNRLADNLQQRKGVAATSPGTGAGQVAPSLPVQEVRAPPTGPASDQSRVTSPVKTQAATTQPKFNVRAMEFKPNPTASTFTPGGAAAPAAGPTAGRHQSVSRAITPSAFFGTRKPRSVSERPAFKDGFNPIKRMKKESLEVAQKKDKDKPPFPFNGGIPYPYSTFPTWDIPKGNEEKTFDQVFKHPSPGSSISPQSRTGSNNPNIPQQHIPFPYPQGNPGMQPSAGPPTGPMINHPHGHQADNHQMHGNPASAQGGFRSPRMLNNHVGYPSQPGMSFGQPPFYGGPQPNHMRHPYQGGPQFVGPPGSMGAPMMVQNPSNGPYMNVPQGMPYNGQMQMPMYSPSPGHVYPHVPQPQPQSGYPSPSRGGAPMMMHQNSQSDHPQPMMFMSPGQPGYGVQPHMPPGGRGGHPHFPSSPHQVHHVPHNQHRGNGFNQVPQLAPHMPSHTPSNSGPSPQTAGNATDEAK